MANAIKPSEISEVLLSQLRDIKSDLQFEEIGKVLQVSDGVVSAKSCRSATASSASTDWTTPRPANCWTAARA